MAFLAVTSRLAQKEQLPSDVASESLPTLSQTDGVQETGDEESLPSEVSVEHPSQASQQLVGTDTVEVLPSSAEEDDILPSSEAVDPADDVPASCPHGEESLQLISS